MRDSVTASANFAGTATKPGASTIIICGMKISPRIVSSPSQNVITEKVSAANCRAVIGPSAASIPANSGTKAALNAPSPNSRRNRFGSRSATKNASATGPAPSRAAISESRRKPSIRLARVQPPTVKTPRSIQSSAVTSCTTAPSRATVPASACPFTASGRQCRWKARSTVARAGSSAPSGATS